MKAHIKQDMPAAEYHAVPACSNSKLSVLATKSPAHLSVERDATEAQIAGTMIHLAVLEPDLFDSSVLIAPAVDRRTKEGKAAYQEFLELSDGKSVVSADEHALYKRIQSQVWADDTARKLLEKGQSEVSVFWEQEGLACKCRFDWISELGVAVDLKTTRDANPKAFMWDAYKFGYHRQLAWYMRGARAAGLELSNMFIIAVEKTEPHPVCVFDLDEQSWALAEEELDILLKKYKQCIETDSWPAYLNEKGTNVHTLSLPYKAFNFNDITENTL